MDLVLAEIARQYKRPQGRPDLAPSEAEEVSQHLDREIRRAPLPAPAGVVSFPLHGEHPAALLEAARHTLIQAGRLGPNTVMVSKWQRSSERVQ